MTLSAALLVAAAFGTPADRVEYYFGDVTIMAADGKVLATTPSLIKREMLPAAGQIVETVLQPARRAGEAAREIVTTMTRRPGAAVFDAQDDGRTFSGTLAFEGAEWAWFAWRYEITLAGGGKLTGSGELLTDGIHTEKTVLDARGAVSIRLRETLAPISEIEYARRRDELLGR